MVTLFSNYKLPFCAVCVVRFAAAFTLVALACASSPNADAGQDSGPYLAAMIWNEEDRASQRAVGEDMLAQIAEQVRQGGKHIRIPKGDYRFANQANRKSHIRFTRFNDLEIEITGNRIEEYGTIPPRHPFHGYGLSVERSINVNIGGNTFLRPGPHALGEVMPEVPASGKTTTPVKILSAACNSPSPPPPLARTYTPRQIMIQPAHHPQNASATRAFTLVELLTIIVIIGILAAILILAVGAVRKSARAAVCISNLRQIHAFATLWSVDHNGIAFPAGGEKISESDDNYFRWRRLMLNLMDPSFDKRGIPSDRITSRMRGKDYADTMWCPSYVATHGKSEHMQGRGGIPSTTTSRCSTPNVSPRAASSMRRSRILFARAPSPAGSPTTALSTPSPRWRKTARSAATAARPIFTADAAMPSFTAVM
jgi:hypothetical protein